MSRPTTSGRFATGILALVLFGAGCEGAGENGDRGLEAEVRDSAGVSIVQNPAPAPGTRLPWSFGAQPSLSIGAIDGGGADQLFRVTDATRLADGRIAIANAGSNELRIFSADGSHAATGGGRGEGPGEFVSYSPSAVAAWPGDSIAAVNPWGTRVSLFDGEGNHGRDVSLDATMLNIVDLLPDGKIFARGGGGGLRGDMTGSSGLVRSDTEWGILGEDGRLLASLGEFPGSEFYAIFAPDGSLQGGMPHPFGRGATGAVWGELVAIGVQDSYEIKAFASDGSLVRVVRRDGDPGRPTQADLDEYYARRYADLPDEDRRSSLDAVRDMPLVESYPAFGEILSDRAGYLWVRAYEAAVWTVFDSEGRVQGIVETPAGLRIFEIGEDYLLGWVSDELGVEYVQLWSLTREFSS